MVVYVEYVFLVNFAADLTLAAVTLRALRRPLNVWRLAIVSVLGAAASVLYCYFEMGVWFKLLLSVFMVLLLSRWKSLRDTAKGLVVFYAISALYAGIAEFFMNLGFGEIVLQNGTLDVSPILTAAAFVAATLVAEGAFASFYQRRKTACRLYSVEVAAGAKTVKTEGFYDTGNTLTEKGEPVVVLSEKLFRKLGAEAVGELPVMTVAGIRVMKKIPLTVKIYYGKGANKLYRVQGVVSDKPLKAPIILNSDFEEER